MLTHHRTWGIPAHSREIATVSEDPYASSADRSPILLTIPSYTAHDEWIAYDPGNRKKKGRTWKTLEHYKRSTVDRQPFVSAVPLHFWTFVSRLNPRLYARIDKQVGSSLYYDECGSMGKFDLNLPSFYNRRSDGGFVSEPPNLDTLILRSLRSMLPLIKAELLSLNSLYELKDFKTLPHTVSKVLLVLARVNGPLRKTLARMTLSAADIYLQKEFNIEPLISDIKAIITSIVSSQKHVSALLERAKQVQVSHFRTTLAEFTDSTESFTPTPNYLMNEYTHLSGYPFPYIGADENQYTTTREVVYEPTSFHAQVQYRFSYSEFQTAYAQLLGQLDSLGINFNAAIIWNAIPWSFVIDWLFGVSRWLTDHRVGFMDPLISIEQYLWSVKRERTIKVTTQIAPPPHFAYPLEWQTGSIRRPEVHEVAYRRQAGLPDFNSFTTSGLSLKEFSLGAALAIGQSKRFKRRRRH